MIYYIDGCARKSLWCLKGFVPEKKQAPSESGQ